MKRRNFLIGSAVVTGGVLFGAYTVTRPPGNPLLARLGEGEAAITPFVKITNEAITLIVPRADLGQGITSMQAHMIAEELDVDPHKVVLEPGQPHPVYANPTVAVNGLPLQPFDKSFVPETIRELMGRVAFVSGAQFTGGSSSVTDLHLRLRTAGAVARETLKLAAAEEMGVSAVGLSTDDGAVVLLDGRRIPYQSLAERVAKLPPAEGVPLREPSEWRYLGKPHLRTDVIAKSTGQQHYGIDVRLDNMLHATVLMNPGRGAGLRRYNADQARAKPGVQSVVEITGGLGVVANNTWRAFQAAEAIEVEWLAPDYPATSEKMWETLERAHNEDHLDSRLRDLGDVEASLAGAQRVVSAEYRTPFVAHGALEPLSATVLYDETQITVWTATQVPHVVRDTAMEMTGYDEDHITVNVLPAGGSFGRRLDHDYVIPAIEIALKHPGKPVKTTWSREEDMMHDFPRPIHLAKGRGVVKDGKVETYDLDSISPSLSKSWFGRVFIVPPGADTLLVWGAYDQPYAIPNYRVSGYMADDIVPIGSWRSPGACSNTFFHEAFLSELIYEAGADPLEERLRLMNEPISRRVLEAAGEMADWNGADIGPNRGRGIAFSYTHHVPVAVVVDVTNTSKGIRIDEVWIAADCGRVFDPVNAEAQLTGGAVWGMAHAMNCELTYADYRPVQTNFTQFQGIRLYQTPQMHTRLLENMQEVRGLGEPSASPLPPALADAIFAATGNRLRAMPFNKFVQFA